MSKGVIKKILDGTYHKVGDSTHPQAVVVQLPLFGEGEIFLMLESPGMKRIIDHFQIETFFGNPAKICAVSQFDNLYVYNKKFYCDFLRFEKTKEKFRKKFVDRPYTTPSPEVRTAQNLHFF